MCKIYIEEIILFLMAVFQNIVIGLNFNLEPLRRLVSLRLTQNVTRV